MKLELSVEDRRGLIGNLYKADEQLQVELRKLAKLYGDYTRHLVRSFAPYRTGHMRKTVRTIYSPSGIIFECGWSFDDFISHGNGRFYVVDQEYGNSNTPAQPSLTPAYEIVAPLYRADVSIAVSSAIRRFNRDFT